MFKKNLLQGALLPVLAAALLGCRTGPPLPPVDLSAPGWTVHQGQAVWRANHKAPEIAGEILLATNSGNRALVQFTKTPFPLVIAQTVDNHWQIEAPAQNRRFTGRGAPPARLIWLQLPRAYTGLPTAKRWRWTSDGGNWRLANRSSGEFLEGYFLEP